MYLLPWPLGPPRSPRQGAGSRSPGSVWARCPAGPAHPPWVSLTHHRVHQRKLYWSRTGAGLDICPDFKLFLESFCSDVTFYSRSLILLLKRETNNNVQLTVDKIPYIFFTISDWMSTLLTATFLWQLFMVCNNHAFMSCQWFILVCCL